MTLILILIGIALVALTAMGKIDMPLWIGFAVAGLGLLWGVIADVLDFSQSQEADETGGNGLNACGCTGNVIYKRKQGLFGREKTATASCSVAQSLVLDKPKKYRIVGCG